MVKNTKKSIKSNPLVYILAGLSPDVEPADLPIVLQDALDNKDIVGEAIEILVEKEKENGRDSKGYIILKIIK